MNCIDCRYLCSSKAVKEELAVFFKLDHCQVELSGVGPLFLWQRSTVGLQFPVLLTGLPLLLLT